MKGKILVLTVGDLLKIASYAHWIPITQGLYKDFFNRNFPGWEWNQIIPALIKRGIIEINSHDSGQRKLSQGLYISSEVRKITIKQFGHRNRISVDKYDRRGIEI